MRANKLSLFIPLIALAALLVAANSYSPRFQDCVDDFGNPVECPTKEPGTSECFDDKSNPIPCPTKEGGGGTERGGGKIPTPTARTITQAGVVLAPVINSFNNVSLQVNEGECGEINWDVKNAQSVTISDEYMGEITVDPQGSMKVCPPATTNIFLTAYGWPGARPSNASLYTVLIVVPSLLPTACTGLNLGPDQIVIDFEDAPSGTLGGFYDSYRYGIQFLAGSGAVPAMGAHSGAKGVISPFGDMGSYTSPIQATLRSQYQKVGLFVGRQTPSEYAQGEVTAILSGQAYDGSGHFVGVVSDAEVLLASALPISRCLLIDAGAGNILRNFTLEYRNAQGQSSWDPRWMDDLTVLPASAHFEDAPPVVTILTPANGSRVIQNRLGLTVNIIEDIGLTEVVYEMRNTGLRPMDFRRSTSTNDPRLYFASSDLDLVLLRARPFVENVLIVHARDTSGQYGQASIRFTYWPVSDLDLEITDVEVTQVIQSLTTSAYPPNSVPLLVGRPTVARVYAAINLGPDRLSDISGAICLGRTGPNGCANPIRPFSVVELRKIAGSLALRPDLTLTLDFLIPPGWYSSPGGLILTAYVNYQEENVDECCTDNNFMRANLNVRQGISYRVDYVRVTANGATSSISQSWPISDYLLKVFPVGRLTTTAPAWVANRNYNFAALPTGNNCGQGWDQLRSDINAARASSPGFSGDSSYGLIAAASITGGTIGCGDFPGTAAEGRVGTADAVNTGAQEIAHNMGRAHAPGCNAGGPDPNYPMSNGTLDEWGLDIARWRLYPAASSYDYLGYCGNASNTWTSIYTYLAILRQYSLFGVASLPDSGAHLASLEVMEGQFQGEGESVKVDPSLIEMFLGGGFVSPDGVDFDFGFTHFPVLIGTWDDGSEGPYTFEMQDAGGAVLYSSTFNLSRGSNSEASDEGAFRIFTPWLDGTQAVVIRYQGAEIGRLTASPNAPTVDLLSPLGGESLLASGTNPISWTASDADGDALHYIVQYSRDGGQNWESLATNLIDSSYSVDLATVAGSSQAMVRVIASDGFNSAVAQSPAAFTVEAKGPEIHIASPDADYALEENWPVVLQAWGTDPEDGYVSPEAFSWTSDVDGDLGVGDQVVSQSLSVGDHTLTVTGTDSDGNVASAKVHITILPSTAGPERSADQLPPFSESFKRTLLIAGVILAVLVAALVMFLRSRKRKLRKVK
jgi:hypothetical protein